MKFFGWAAFSKGFETMTIRGTFVQTCENMHLFPSFLLLLSLFTPLDIYFFLLLLLLFCTKQMGYHHPSILSLLAHFLCFSAANFVFCFISAPLSPVLVLCIHSFGYHEEALFSTSLRVLLVLSLSPTLLYLFKH